jgi:hypothetical protein
MMERAVAKAAQIRRRRPEGEHFLLCSGRLIQVAGKYFVVIVVIMGG